MPRGKTQRSLDLIEACFTILQDIHPATVRAVCYQLFIRQLIPSMAKTCTNRVSAQLVYAREKDIIPWAWIVDETREAERPATWANPESFIRVVMRSYRRDRWELQPRRVEVWSEKGTIRGTLAPVLEGYGVTFRVMHGHGSATALFNAAEETLLDENPRIILYLGDWDPSGLHMSERDIPDRLDRYAGEAKLIRVALSGEDVAPHHSTLPSFPASEKATDSRYRWFVTHYGDTCWELDALSPTILRERVAAAVERYIEWEAWFRCEEVEQAEHRSLSQILNTWPRAISGQASI